MKLLRPTHPYVRLAEGFVYLAAILDAFSRKVVGWALAGHLEASLATEALDMALATRDPAPDSLIHHSDRGVQGGFNRSSHRLAYLIVERDPALLQAFSNLALFLAWRSKPSLRPATHWRCER